MRASRRWRVIGASWSQFCRKIDRQRCGELCGREIWPMRGEMKSRSRNGGMGALAVVVLAMLAGMTALVVWWHTRAAAALAGALLGGGGGHARWVPPRCN